MVGGVGDSGDVEGMAAGEVVEVDGGIGGGIAGLVVPKGEAWPHPLTTARPAIATNAAAWWMCTYAPRYERVRLDGIEVTQCTHTITLGQLQRTGRGQPCGRGHVLRT